MAKIHPTSVVMDGAILGDGVEIGPLCYVGPNVRIGAGTRLIAQCNVDGYTTIGENNILHPFAAIGQPAQDHAVEPGAATYVEIGDRNVFRESTTVHSGTKPGTKTIIGSDCLFMATSHVAHNCKVGNHVTYVNGAVTGGYAEIEDNVILSGLVAIHQFCRVGRLTIISGLSAYSKDVPPFMMAEGRNGGVKMINKIGLQRAGFDEETITVIKHMHRIFFRSELTLKNALEKIKTELPQIPAVQEFVNFCENSPRGIIGGKVAGHRS